MFNFNSKVLGAAASLPIVAAGLMASAGSAQAAALVGDFSFNGGVTVPGGVSNVTLTKDTLIFNPNSPDIVPPDNGAVSPVILGSQSGSFLGFNSAGIRDINFFGPPINVQNPFLDFGSLTIDGIVGIGPYNSIVDEQNVFNLSSASYSFKQSGANVSIDVALWGTFVSSTGHTSNGAGNLTFQLNNADADDVEDFIAGGGTLSNLTFSGALFTATAVPEPTTMLGLGLVGAGMTFARRRKAVKA